MIKLLLFAALCGCAWESRALSDLVSMSPEQARQIGIQTRKPESTHELPLVRAPARVTLPPQNEYVASAAQAGLISKVEVALGESVRKGQTLALIESPGLITLQRGVLDSANSLALTQSRLNRDQALLSEGIIASLRFEETRSNHERAQTALNEAEQVLEVAGVSARDVQQLRKTHKLNPTLALRSPMDGVVLERMAVAGQRTEPLAPLFRIGKLDELWLEIDLPQEHLKEIRLHDRVYLDVYETDARITHIGQNISSGSQSVLLRAIIEKPGDRIKPGQFVSVQLMHASSDDLLRLPVAALIHQDGKDYVFVRVANGYAPRAVSVASRESRQVLIHEGLKPTDEVVVQGVAALKASWVGIGSDE